METEELLMELCEYIFDMDDLGNYSCPHDTYLDAIAQKINEYFDDSK